MRTQTTRIAPSAARDISPVSCMKEQECSIYTGNSSLSTTSIRSIVSGERTSPYCQWLQFRDRDLWWRSQNAGQNNTSDLRRVLGQTSESCAVFFLSGCFLSSETIVRSIHLILLRTGVFSYHPVLCWWCSSPELEKCLCFIHSISPISGWFLWLYDFLSIRLSKFKLKLVFQKLAKYCVCLISLFLIYFCTLMPLKVFLL